MAVQFDIYIYYIKISGSRNGRELMRKLMKGIWIKIGCHIDIVAKIIVPGNK